MTGLFHLAVLLPSRRDLAVALRRLAEARVPLDGASDHLVSEALYLHDPDRNGIEIYRDRAREQWPHVGGSLEMATLPLDIDDILTQLPPGSAKDAFAPAGTQIGHVHLQVADLDAATTITLGSTPGRALAPALRRRVRSAYARSRSRSRMPTSSTACSSA